MTLDNLYTTTTVEFNNSFTGNEVVIDGSKASEEEASRVSAHLELIKELAGDSSFARVLSQNNFPKKAGIASSASGFAALTLAASAALDLQLSTKDLSILARRGSGSASRSFDGGFVEWQMGSEVDGSDSHAVQLAGPTHWPNLAIVVTVLSTQPKKTGSRAGMRQTVATSPLYQAWLSTVGEDLAQARKAIEGRDFHALGKTAELNALKMHATMHTTQPPIIYWEPQSVELMKEVVRLREEEGLGCYFTMDAGPQVKILCEDHDLPRVVEMLAQQEGVLEYHLCHPGPNAQLIEDHLY